MVGLLFLLEHLAQTFCWLNDINHAELLLWVARLCARQILTQRLLTGNFIYGTHTRLNWNSAKSHNLRDLYINYESESFHETVVQLNCNEIDL